MIKNLPNKYTLNLLLDDLNQNFENKFDFINLPVDIKVIKLYRINVMLVMLLLILFLKKIYLIFINNIMGKNGGNFLVIKYLII